MLRNPIPDSHRDLLERPIVVSLAALQPDGSPQVMPMWADLEDGKVRVNAAVGRQKHANMVARPAVSVLVIDPDDSFRFLEVRGRVISWSVDRDTELHADKLVTEYRGPEFVPTEPRTETRSMFVIEPVRVLVSE